MPNQNERVSFPLAELEKIIDWFSFMAGYVRGHGDIELATQLLKISVELKNPE